MQCLKQMPQAQASGFDTGDARNDVQVFERLLKMNALMQRIANNERGKLGKARPPAIKCRRGEVRLCAHSRTRKLLPGRH